MEGVWSRKRETQLRIVGGTPLVDNRVSYRRSPHLTLVWNQGGILAPKRPKKVDSGREVLPVPWYRKIWHWLNESSGVWQSLGVIGVILWFAFSINSRLEQLEEKINGEGGLITMSREVGKINNRLTRIEERLKAIDKYVLPYVLPQTFRPKAVALGFIDPQMVVLTLGQSSEIHLTRHSDNEDSYDFTLRLQSFGEHEISFFVEGKIGPVTMTRSTIGIPRKIGVPMDFWEVVKDLFPSPATLSIPPLWVVILDFPNPDTAVIAFGARVKDNTKSDATPAPG